LPAPDLLFALSFIDSPVVLIPFITPLALIAVVLDAAIAHRVFIALPHVLR
jgi:hypothetical protein